MTHDFNPELLLRERVFQRIIDHYGIDPQKAKWSLFRLFAVGMALSCAAVSTLGPEHLSSISNRIGLLIVFLGSTFQIWIQTVIPRHLALAFPATFLRTLYTLAAIVFVVLSVQDALSLDTEPVMERIGLYGLAVSWLFGVASIYLNACRTTPPRRPRPARGTALGVS